MLYHLLDRIAGCRFIQDQRDIVVCTIEEATDDPLVSAVEAWGASVLRGPRDDVIRRFADAIEIHRFDGVVQANGDTKSILKGISKALAYDRSGECVNYYGDGRSSERIRDFVANIMASRSRSEILRKKFVDIGK